MVLCVYLTYAGTFTIINKHEAIKKKVVFNVTFGLLKFIQISIFNFKGP